MERQGGFRLLGFYFRQVPKKLLKLLQGSSHDVFIATDPREKIESCICPMHLNNGK